MIKAIVGANWGDEGKGKVTDVFAQQSDIVVRFQGGNNAGHTIINEYGKFALHMLPSGVFNPHITNVIGNGVALNVGGLMKEINEIKARGLNPNLMVSDRAQIVMSYHILFDTLEEARLANKQYGSTKSGIAPFYSDKYAKIGFQVCELFDDVWLGYRDQIAPYVHDTISFLHKAYQEKKTILLEGQLGALRDPDFGIYPYSTSSHTLAHFGAIGAGLPYPIEEVWAVTKAYSSAVGAGPFVAEIFDDEAHQLRIRGGVRCCGHPFWLPGTRSHPCGAD